MKILIIGAGASGLMAGITSAKEGNDVTILEKTSQAGKKLLISGKGRCNLTNSVDISEFFNNIPGNANFLYSALYSFTNTDMINFIESLGVKTKVERGGRVFPLSDKSSDILNALLKEATRLKVKIQYNSKVEEIITKDNVAVGLVVNGEKIYADKIILATGGVSFKGTGSTGDGYKIAEKLGHTIIKPKPSLVGLDTEESFVSSMAGLTLKNVSITLKNDKNKKIYEDFGEMLITHTGVSGPIILSASRALHPYMDENNFVKNVKLYIDLKPALDNEKLENRIMRDFEKYKNKQFKNALFDLLPESMIPVVIKISGINEEKQVNAVTKKERKNLVTLLKSFPLTIKNLRSIDEAIVTAGGIKVSEINPSTMESKLIKNLYFCGEVIDVDAYTGGFNLQIAFSTGVLAGKN
ncbi:MAG: NAD(P)/FAD-dependent oxidoreductase [Clostridia bacterium]|nr:NAD(P)/FAD-dependent oxidoreductase [Clostridia bacterium]